MTAIAAATAGSATAVMACVDDFARLAVPGSRWRYAGVRSPAPHATVLVVQPYDARPGRAVRCRGVWADGSRFERGWLEPPEQRGPLVVRFAGDTAHEYLDVGDGALAWLSSWTYLGQHDGPFEQPAADPAAVRWCRAQRLQPGDVVYRPVEPALPDPVEYAHRPRQRAGGSPGYTVATVTRVSDSRVVIATVEGWPLAYAPWTMLPIVPAGGLGRCQGEPAPLRPPWQEDTRVYLGVNTLAWLGRDDLAGVPKCVSRNRVAGYRSRTVPRSRSPLLIDSGGFSELKNHGRWRQTPAEYVAQIREVIGQVGRENVAAIAGQDWMCEDVVINGGKTKDGTFVGTRQFLDPDWQLSMDEMVRLHQQHTTDNAVALRTLAPDLPIFPTLQGNTPAQYLRHALMYLRAGFLLGAEQLVGLGSVCRRQGSAEVERIVRSLAGIRLHGFGVGVQGLSRYGRLLVSVDSNAWSYDGRWRGLCVHGVVVHEANCPVHARDWWERAMARLARRPDRWAALLDGISTLPGDGWTRLLDTAPKETPALNEGGFRREVATRARAR